MKITKLTPRQSENLPLFVEKWTKMGLATKLGDKQKIKKNIIKAYKMVNLDKPKVIFIEGGPMALIDKFIELNAPRKLTRKEALEELSGSIHYGTSEAAWLSFYDFFLRNGDPNGEIDPVVTGPEKLLPHMEIVEAGAGWMLLYRTLVIVSEPPVEIHLKQINNRKLLHRDGGPAIRYSDGFCVYALNGVRLPKGFEWIATTREEQLDPRRIAEIPNAEVRREFVRKVGIDRICHSNGAEVIDREGNYELLLLDIGDGHKRPYLKMRNPSIGCWHVEGVPPGIKTVSEANLWRRGEGFEQTPTILT